MPPEVYPVGQVARYLRELLESDRHLSEIWVGGEVSNFSRASSGHMFFTLKDGSSGLRCVFFRNRNLGLRTPLADGLSVVVYGSLSLYEQRGELSFVVDFVQPEGTGALAAEFERRRATFEAEGLFAVERKRDVPTFPNRIGVVTSATGAVFHDICDVLARRWPSATIVLQPTPVQGEGSGPAIAEAIRAITRSQQIDVLIVARGGGAAEDLWAFNEEPVVRAIFGSPVPVVSAVGHETDVTLADMVADLRAPTPSAAAELVALDRLVVVRHVAALTARAHIQVSRLLNSYRDALESRRMAIGRGMPRIEALRERVHERRLRLTAATAAACSRTDARLHALSQRLRALSPLATLERGYAIVSHERGSVVTAAAELVDGEYVQMRLSDGSRRARVESSR